MVIAVYAIVLCWYSTRSWSSVCRETIVIRSSRVVQPVFGACEVGVLLELCCVEAVVKRPLVKSGYDVLLGVVNPIIQDLRLQVSRLPLQVKEKSRAYVDSIVLVDSVTYEIRVQHRLAYSKQCYGARDSYCMGQAQTLPHCDNIL